MDSLATEICCSINQKTHPHSCNLTTGTSIPPSPSAAASSRHYPKTCPTALLNADKKKIATSGPLLPLPSSRSLFPSSLKFLWFGRDSHDSEASDHDSNFPMLPTTDGELKTDDIVSDCPCSIDDASVEAHSSHTSKDMTSSTSIANADILDELCEQPGMLAEASTPESLWSHSNSIPPSDNSWTSSLQRLSTMWKSSDPMISASQEVVESALLMAAHQSDITLVDTHGADCFDDEVDKNDDGNRVSVGGVDDDSDDDEQSLCMLELEKVVHDRNTMARFLEEVPVESVQAISKLSLLNNLAYIIPEVQSKGLLKDHHLSFVTSSLVKKKEADSEAALAQAIADANKEIKQVMKKRLKYQSEGLDNIDNYSNHNRPAQAIADANKEIKQVMKKKLKYQSEGLDNDNYSNHNRPTPASNANKSDLSAQDRNRGTSAQTPLARVVLTSSKEKPNLKEGSTKKKAKEGTSKMQSHCPCEWFICDDEASNTRYLVIQGSESLASWKTNLTFDPTKFEGIVGVMVHRGVYEAAQGLYYLVQKEVVEHVKKGSHARLCFTGHSLGGSLATLLAMMLVKRGVVKASEVEGVVTLGAPCVLCAGERVLKQLRLREQQFVNVVMHRDIVPRAFACDYPRHVARLLERVSDTFRNHPCLNYQHALYAPVGQMMILQPDAVQSPSHPLLHCTAGLFLIRHPWATNQGHGNLDAAAKQLVAKCRKEVREAQRAFFNMPHPLETLSDPSSYGFASAILRDHDPRSYDRAINTVLSRRLIRLRRQRRAQLRSGSPTLLSAVQYPLSSTSPLCHAPSASASSAQKHGPLIPSQHIHMGLLFILSITSELFASILSWA